MSSSIDLLAGHAIPLGDPSTPEAVAMRAAYWALDGRGPVAALCAGLPRLLAQLARRTARRRVEAPAVRGRIDWPATVRARVASGSASTLVSRVVERVYDVPENQLLRFVIARCLDTLDHVPDAIRDGALQEAVGAAVAVGPVRERIDLLRGVLRDRKLHARLAAVALPSRLDARWVNAARAADVRKYALVVDAYVAWQRLVEAPTWDHVATPGGVILLPASPDAQRWLALAARRTSRARRLGGV